MKYKLRTNVILKKSLYILLGCVYIFSITIGRSSAMSPQDISDLLNQHPNYLAQANDTTCNASGQPVTPPAGTVLGQLKPGAKIFYLGDSLTYGMTLQGQLLDKTKAAGFDVSTDKTDTAIPFPNNGLKNGGVQGPSVDATGGITIGLTTKLIIDRNATNLSAAGGIVIGLGTNARAEAKADIPGDATKKDIPDSDIATAQAAEIPLLIKKLRDPPISSTAPIYWVNTYFTNTGYGNYVTVNQTIAQSAVANNYTVIDLAGAVAGGKLIAPEGGDNVHYSPTGYKTRSDYVVGQLTALSTAAAPVSPPANNAYDPTSLAYPAFPDEAAIATDIVNYIKKTAPTSPWLTIPGIGDSIGTWIMQESKTRNINPLFIVASGHIESGFGTQVADPNQHNYFGIKSSSPPPDYRTFATAQDGLRFFMDTVQNNTQSPTSRYSQAKNIYEYFSIHQTGSIVYPGEPLDPRDADTKPGVTQDLWDNSMGVWISWDPAKNKDNTHTNKQGQFDHRGMYNPLTYYASNISVINAVTGLNLSSTNPTRGGGLAIQPTNLPGCSALIGSPVGAGGWDLPGEGSNPLIYYSQLTGCPSGKTCNTSVKYFGDLTYGSGDIKTCGCAPTSLAMIIATLTGKPVTPKELITWLVDNKAQDADCGTNSSFLNKPNNSFSTTFGVSYGSITASQVADSLKAGKLVLMSVNNSAYPVANDTQTSGHYLVIRKVQSDGTFLFADPFAYGWSAVDDGSKTPYTIDQISGMVRTGIWEFSKI